MRLERSKGEDMAKEKKSSISIDVQSGSRSFNRLDMQVTQALHMVIELFENVDFLVVMDYYDDISIFDNSEDPKMVSYYQMKTSNDVITINTILKEEWLSKLYQHLNNPKYLIENLGLITNSPIKLDKQTLKEEQTSFSRINQETVEKIKKDISNKMKIQIEDVDLSKFIHLRTTLTIERHRDIVEQELSNFLQKKYPKITVESVKSIFQSVIDMLTKRQEYELVEEKSEFPLVKAKKGTSKEDIDRVIKMTMLLSIPEFSIIEKLINFENDEKFEASYEYTKILSDLQKRDEGFMMLIQKIQNIIRDNPMFKDEEYTEYSNRITKLIPENPVYNVLYKKILIASIQYNTWKDELL